MKILRITIWILGLLGLLYINALGALPRFHKGVQHPAGADVVSVYPADSQHPETATPIKDWDRSKESLVNTDQSVQVYIRNNYKDNLIVFYPRLTLLITLLTLIVQFVLWRISRRA